VQRKSGAQKRTPPAGRSFALVSFDLREAAGLPIFECPDDNELAP
jgi:hypothetical protein